MGNVDLARKQLTVDGAYAKNGETRTIPINSELHAALSKLRKVSTDTGPEDPIFVAWKGPRKGEQLKSIRTAFDTAQANRGSIERCDAPHAEAHLRLKAGYGRRRPPHRPGARRMERVGHGGTICPYEPEPQSGRVERIMEQKPGSIPLRYSLHRDRASS